MNGDWTVEDSRAALSRLRRYDLQSRALLAAALVTFAVVSFIATRDLRLSPGRGAAWSMAFGPLLVACGLVVGWALERRWDEKYCASGDVGASVRLRGRFALILGRWGNVRLGFTLLFFAWFLQDRIGGSDASRHGEWPRSLASLLLATWAAFDALHFVLYVRPRVRAEKARFDVRSSP